MSLDEFRCEVIGRQLRDIKAERADAAKHIGRRL